MMMIKNMKYSRWVGDDDDEEHKELTMSGRGYEEEHEVLTKGW